MFSVFDAHSANFNRLLVDRTNQIGLVYFSERTQLGVRLLLNCCLLHKIKDYKAVFRILPQFANFYSNF